MAYCNAPVGAKLPDGMPDWPAVRAKNGHPAPFGVKLFQIGNEWFGFRERALKAAGVGNDKTGAAWYVECLNAYADLMRAVDPTIDLIVDGVGGPGDPLMGPFLQDASVRKKVRYATFHAYGPWEMNELRRGGKVVSFDDISREDVWRVWIATPGSFSERGECLGFGHETAWVANLGYRVVCTEWNWNGWGDQHRQARLGMDPDAAKAIGAAGFLHGLMRFAGDFDLACQSNLIGCGWAIGGVQVDPEGKRPVHYSPTGQVTMFFAAHHGSRVLKVASDSVPTYAQPYQLGAARELAKVMLVDAVASADDKVLYFHAISREFEKPVRIVIDLGRWGASARAPRIT